MHLSVNMKMSAIGIIMKIMSPRSYATNNETVTRCVCLSVSAIAPAATLWKTTLHRSGYGQDMRHNIVIFT